MASPRKSVSPSPKIDLDSHSWVINFNNYKFGWDSYLSYYDEKVGDVVDMTPERLREIVYPKKQITLVDHLTGIKKTYKSKNGFSRKALYNAILNFKNMLAQKYYILDWHPHFEGLTYKPKDKAYRISTS